MRRKGRINYAMRQWLRFMIGSSSTNTNLYEFANESEQLVRRTAGRCAGWQAGNRTSQRQILTRPGLSGPQKTQPGIRLIIFLLFFCLDQKKRSPAEAGQAPETSSRKKAAHARPAARPLPIAIGMRRTTAQKMRWCHFALKSSSPARSASAGSVPTSPPMGCVGIA